MSELTDRLKAAPKAPTKAAERTKQFTRDLSVTHNTAELQANAVPVDEANEGTALVFLEEEGLNPLEWEVTHFRKIKYGEGLCSVKCSYRRIRGAGTLALPDLDDLHLAAERSVRSEDVHVVTENLTVVGVIADPQIGKVEANGGIEALLARLEKSRQAWARYLKLVEPTEIILIDAGDSIEGFENVPIQDRTNDLQLTEMIRVWRRVLFSWVQTAAELCDNVKVLAVGSNHARVRRGKGEMGPPTDDYGIEVLAQVSDMCGVYPDKFGHVQFYAPEGYDESVAIEAVGGKVIGVAHGHQVTRPDALPQWIANQSLGRTPIGQADLMIFGHWHHLRIQTIGDDRWMFIAPTSDNGSSWYRNLSGNASAPGVMTFVLDPDGWSDLHIC